MPQVRLDDSLIYYSERGRGEPLLLLMGLGGSHRSWGEPFLCALEQSFRVIALDHRGTGRSTRGRVDYTISRLAADAAAVLDRIGAGSAHVFGLSMGRMVAQELALNHPGSVRGLILASTTCGGRGAVWPSAALRRRFTDGVGESAWPIIVSPRFAAEHGSFLRWIAWDALTAGMTPSGLRDQARAVSRFGSFDRLSGITAPTLVMAGEVDVLIPPANARILQRAIHGAQGVLVRGAGHVFVWEAPERSAIEVTGFLSGVRDGHAPAGVVAL